MKRFAIAVVCLAGALAAGACADEQADFVGWMKTTGGTMGKLRKEIEANDFSDVSKDATTLEGVFKHVAEYFAKTNAPDAVDSAHAAGAAAKKLVEAANASDAGEAGASLKAVAGTCHGCHEAHREKLDSGGYKIK